MDKKASPQLSLDQMAYPKLKKQYFLYDSADDSDDSERFASDNELGLKVTPLHIGDCEDLSLSAVANRKRKDPTYQKALLLKAHFLRHTYLNVERNRIVLRRALRRVERQRNALEEYIDRRVLMTEPAPQKPDDEPDAISQPSTQSSTPVPECEPAAAASAESISEGSTPEATVPTHCDDASCAMHGLGAIGDGRPTSTGRGKPVLKEL